MISVLIGARRHRLQQIVRLEEERAVGEGSCEFCDSRIVWRRQRKVAQHVGSTSAGDACVTDGSADADFALSRKRTQSVDKRMESARPSTPRRPSAPNVGCACVCTHLSMKFIRIVGGRQAHRALGAVQRVIGVALPARRPQRADGRTLLLCPEIGRLSKNCRQIAVTMPPQRCVDRSAVIFGCASEQSGGDARADLAGGAENCARQGGCSGCADSRTAGSDSFVDRYSRHHASTHHTLPRQRV